MGLEQPAAETASACRMILLYASYSTICADAGEHTVDLFDGRGAEHLPDLKHAPNMIGQVNTASRV